MPPHPATRCIQRPEDASRLRRESVGHRPTRGSTTDRTPARMRRPCSTRIRPQLAARRGTPATRGRSGDASTRDPREIDRLRAELEARDARSAELREQLRASTRATPGRSCARSASCGRPWPRTARGEIAWSGGPSGACAGSRSSRRGSPALREPVRSLGRLGTAQPADRRAGDTAELRGHLPADDRVALPLPASPAPDAAIRPGGPSGPLRREPLPRRDRGADATGRDQHPRGDAARRPGRQHLSALPSPTDDRARMVAAMERLAAELGLCPMRSSSPSIPTGPRWPSRCASGSAGRSSTTAWTTIPASCTTAPRSSRPSAGWSRRPTWSSPARGGSTRASAPDRGRPILIRNACEYEHFCRGRRPAAARPGEPTIGYYGAIAEWFDGELVAEAGRAAAGLAVRADRLDPRRATSARSRTSRMSACWANAPMPSCRAGSPAGMPSSSRSAACR